jgi:hypothetical protein
LIEAGLPLWIVPAQDEPAYGMLIRLAERNGLSAPNHVSSLIGLNVRDLRRGVGIDRLASVLQCNEAAIRHSSPMVRNGVIELRGDKIACASEMKSTTRRLCSDCVAESAHHRFWFDFEFLSTCPSHKRALTRLCPCGQRLGWSDATVRKCRRCQGDDVVRISGMQPRLELLELDQWLLSRLGVGTASNVPVLDALPLRQVLDILAQIGILDIGGYRKHWTEARDLDLTVADVRSRGFRILRDGALDAVLDRIYNEYLASPEAKAPTMKTAYGWFGHWFASLAAEGFPQDIADIVFSNATRKFYVRRFSHSVTAAPKAA